MPKTSLSFFKHNILKTSLIPEPKTAWAGDNQ